MPYKFDREFYRLQYPIEAAPRLVEVGATHRIVDIGEGGFRFAPSSGLGPPVGQPFAGVIEFPEGESIEVAGVVVRVQAGEVAVHCTPRPIPLAVVLSEQRRVRRKYPFRT